MLERLGVGGMGEVYLANDTRLNRKVALKYLSDRSLTAPHARARLLREARAAAQITHPNIAAIYDILDTESPPCIVMEYAPGDTLAKLASRGPVACGKVLKIGVQLAGALSHAHAAGVIHRDLKPANAVLTDDGTVKILDFGLARIPEVEQELAVADTTTTRTVYSRYGPLAGTPAYMAPEQLAGRPATALSDVYALGVTLYELLTGHRPFEAKSAVDLVYEVLSKPTPRASEINPSVPCAVDAIVARAMARDLDERYQSAAQMADDLRQAERDLSGEGERLVSHASVAGPLTPAPGPVRPRRRFLRTAAWITAAVALVATGYGLWGRRAAAVPPRPQSIAVLPFANATGDRGAAPLAVGFSESLAAALEGLSSVTTVRKPGPEVADRLPASADFARSATQFGVTTIVSGSVSRQGESYRFLVQVRRVDGKKVFEKEYPGALADVARLQGRAVSDVVAALNLTLTPADLEHLRRSPVCRADAYGDYAAGRALLERVDIPGNALRAQEVFARAGQKDPHCAPAFAGLSDAYWAEYSETKAVSLVQLATKAIEEAARLDPYSPTIQTSLAAVYVSTGRTSQGETKIREVVAQRPLDDAPLRVLADALTAQGRTEEAIATLMRAIDLQPANVLNQIALGVAFYRANRYADAAGVFTRILERQPDNLWAITNLGASYQRLDQPAKALEVYKGARQPDADILSNIGYIYYSDGRFADAARAFEESVKLDPRSDVKHRNLGDAYMRLGSRTRAMEEYRLALALTRDQLKVSRQAGTLAKYAVYAAKLGLGEEAVQCSEEAFKLSPENGTVMYKKAVVHALLGETQAAVSWLDRALQKGYSPSSAASDDDLRAIRALPQVAAMLREEAREKR